MIYIQGMAWQTQVFFLCIGFGFLLGLIYDLFRFVRKSFFHFKGALFLQDVLFFAFATVYSFLFTLCVNDSELRLYPYLGLIFGFSVYCFTLRMIVRPVFDKISGVFGRTILAIRSFIKNNFKKIIKKLKKRANKPEKNLEKQIYDSV